MTFIIGLFLRMGVPQRFASILGYVAAAIGAGALLALLCWALIAHGKALGKADCEKAQLAATNAALIVNDKAKDVAGVERANDTATITNSHEERTHAIEQAPASGTGAASRALGCVRWKQQHQGATTLPTGC